MKRLFYIVATLAFFCGCEQADDFEQPAQGGAASGEMPEVIYATVADDDSEGDKTRTVVAEDSMSILWNTGDAIAYIGPGAYRAKYMYEGDDRVASAAFAFKENGNAFAGALQPAIPYAVYPYNCGAYCKTVNGVNALAVNFPAEQTYAANSFGRDASLMVAMGEIAGDTDFYFRNACGYLVIKLYDPQGVSVKKIELTALGGEKLSGTGYIVASHDAAPVVNMDNSAKSTVALNCPNGVALGTDAEHATEFWFALPPVTFSEGFKILVTPTQGGAFAMQTSRQVEITRNDIQPMATLQYTPNAIAPNQLYYTRKNGNATPYDKFKVGENTYFDATITAHYYDERIGKLIIEFDAPLATIKRSAFEGENVGIHVTDTYEKPTKVTDITSVTFPESLVTIGSYAFAGTALTSVTIPGHIATVGCYAFWECRDLASISILEGDKPLKLLALDLGTTNAPFGFSKITSIYINRDIDYRNDRDEAFDYGENFEGVFTTSPDYFGSIIAYVDEVSLEIGPKVTTILPYMFSRKRITSLTIPEGVISIGERAFAYCDALTTLTIKSPAGGSNIFKDCKNLASVTFSGTCSNIYKNMFSGCSNLGALNITGSVETIDESAFDGFNLTSLNISGHVGTIGKGAFDDCDKMTAANITGTVNTIGEEAFYHCNVLASVTLPEGLTSIGKYAFYNCDKLTSVTLPSSLTTIDYGAFYDCGGLTSVSIPASVTTVGDYAFYNCGALTTATLAGQTIGMGVLYNCDGLTDLTIKGTVNKIGNDPFYDCDNLSRVTFEPSPTNTALTLGYQTYGADDQGPFYDSPLSYINLDREINYACGDLDEWDEGVFANLHYADGGLTTEVTLGSSVETIWPFMFSGVRMTSVTIPASVTSVGKKAFLDCRVLTHVTCKSATPPTLGSDAFNSCDKLPSEKCIAVPTGSLSDYQSVWSQYSSKLYEY